MRLDQLAVVDSSRRLSEKRTGQMHTIRTAIPEPSLRPFVRCFAQREMPSLASPFRETALASRENILDFCLAAQSTTHHRSGHSTIDPRINILGTQTRSLGWFSFKGSVLDFGIFLKPFAPWQLFGILPAELANQKFEASTVFGSWCTELWLKLSECRTFPERIQVATQTLLRFAEYPTPQTRTMAAAGSFFQPASSIRVEQLAQNSYMSVRTFERRFVKETGISPKLFLRLQRFQMALDRKRASGDRWLDIAHFFGYSDQMHMVKEFREFGGEAPSRLLQNCGDYQPWSIGGDA
jgi:AraC-like DNA-binding protein